MASTKSARKPIATGWSPKAAEPLSYAEKAEKAQAEKILSAQYAARSDALAKIIRPLHTAAYECDCDFRGLRRALDRYQSDWGGMDLTPDFQRGHVWSPDQQRHYIENVLRGVVSSAGFVVQFNCPNWDDDHYAGDLPRGFQCIDGLQRITAVLALMDGQLQPFGLSLADLELSRFSIQSCIYRLRIAVHTFQTKSELLQHYIDLNAGGTPHSADEIARVRDMRAALLLAAR